MRFDTVYHEMRHAEQWDVVQDLNAYRADPKGNPWTHPDISLETAQAWKDNYYDYVTPEEDFQGYLDQPIEADAREAGEKGVDEMTNDKLNEYKKK